MKLKQFWGGAPSYQMVSVPVQLPWLQKIHFLVLPNTGYHISILTWIGLEEKNTHAFHGITNSSLGTVNLTWDLLLSKSNS